MVQPTEQSHQEALVQQDPGVSIQNVNSNSGSIQTQIYHRLGLTMPRWLFWFMTSIVGVTLSGLLVSTLALWTPLWSNMDSSEEELGWTTGASSAPSPIPGDLWSDVSKYDFVKPMNILVMGIEPVSGSVNASPDSFSGKSDSMLLVRLDPKEKTIRVLSIPRDTMIAIPEKGLNKVSQANAQGGPVLAARVVSRTLSNAPIDRYIRVSTSGFRQLVDQLGGVEVFVPEKMKYKDTAARLHINLVSGWQNLNGTQAEQFARYRSQDMGDLKRVQRQQALLSGLRDRLSSPTVLPKLPQLIRIMGKYVDTNLKLEEMMALVNFALNLERSKFQMTILPGTFSRFSQDPNSYWLNLTGKGELLEEYAGVTIAGLKPNSRAVTSLKIAIQNTANKPQITQEAIALLKKQGFSKVYSTDPWNDPRSQTQIIVQKGNIKAAEAIQKILKFGEIKVSSTGDIESDLTIRIGNDWK
ncbi:MAG: LCP family protein [Cyanobacteria bacterium P01_A01_bin.84]